MNFTNFSKVRLVFLLILGAIAATTMQAAVVNHNIANGHLIIHASNNGTDYKVTGTTTTNKIIVGSGYQGTITLSGVNITSSGAATVTALCGNGTNTVTTGSPMAVMGLNSFMVDNNNVEWNTNLNPVTKVNIVLEGTNTLLFTGSGYCGLQVDQGSQINISAIDPSDNGSGVLFAKATQHAPTSTTSKNGGAGIGALANLGSPYNIFQGDGTIYNPNGSVLYSPPTLNQTGAGHCRIAGGNIVIASGTITAWGGHGAGIGGGYRTYYNGVIAIYGGVVEAYAGYHAAGIGSGCPRGTGIVPEAPANGAVIALPPCRITAFGAHQAYGVPLAELALTGTKNVTYINDPNKHLMTIHTVDYEPNATIYLDLTETTGLVDIFRNTLRLDYDLTKVRIGRTNASGTMELRGQLEQNTTFFTDASSSKPATMGRPYLPVETTVLANKDISLPLLGTNISFTDYPSTPMEEGYSSTLARASAPYMKVEYNDNYSMTNVTFQIQGGASSDFRTPPIFLAANGVTEIPRPTTMNPGDVFYIILPIKDNKPRGVYSDVLLINGEWMGIPLPGHIRRIGEQRVSYEDTNTNDHIRVTASPSTFDIEYPAPATATTTLTLNINHAGHALAYDELDVYARYLITTEANYAAALAATPLNTWSILTAPTAENVNATTIASFVGKPAGIYYIHWYVVSGTVYAHSRDVISPAATHGGFGPYNVGQGTKVDVTVFLQGSMQTNGTMTNYIQVPNSSRAYYTQPRLPLGNVYGLGITSPDVNNVSVVGEVVDWIRVEIRKVSTPGVIVEAKSLFLRPNGKIVDLNGVIPTFTPQTDPVYIAVKHRNHLSVASNAISSLTGNITYDFSTALTQAYKYDENHIPMIQSNGKWCLWAGDVDGNGLIDHVDATLTRDSFRSLVTDSYTLEDFNMDGISDHVDVVIESNSVSNVVYSPLLYW